VLLEEGNLKRVSSLQTVRRDNCRLVQTVIETCLHKMLIDRDVKGAEE
jgi:DNA polymerase delta subunit 1